MAIVKPENLWYYESSKCAPQFALRYLRQAWDRAFKKTSKPPKFKKKGRNDSFTLDGTIKVIDHYKIQLPKIGVVKTYERLAYGYKPKSVTRCLRHLTFAKQRHWAHSRPRPKAGNWYISYKVEVEEKDSAKTVDRVGVDLGVKTLAYLSTGITFTPSMPYRKYQKRLSRLQWLNRNKVIGSNAAHSRRASLRRDSQLRCVRKKSQLKIAKLHAKISNIRRDTLHKLTTYLAKNHSEIVIEDLNVSGLLKNRKLAKAIADMGFYEFRRQLEYKCKLYGSKLVVADRFFASSKTCSNAEANASQSSKTTICAYALRWHNPDLKLSDRWFLCVGCGSFLDRDWNASLNLSRWSHRRTQACG